MRAEGAEFRCSVTAGRTSAPPTCAPATTRSCSPGGATRGARPAGARQGTCGVHLAMEYLPLANRVQRGRPGRGADQRTGKNVVIIGGGDTGADCLGTALRQGAASVTQLEIMPRPPGPAAGRQPWPTCPLIYRVVRRARGGRRARLRGVHPGVPRRRRRRRGCAPCGSVDVELAGGRLQPVQGTEREIPLRARAARDGVHRTRAGPVADRPRRRVRRARQRREGRVVRDSVPGVFAAGDMGRGQSLIVWAIAEGPPAAAAVDRD